jgi:osmoprotectant transport system permease protein
MNRQASSTARTRELDKVGLVAAAVGLASYLALPFATVRHSRIATGVDVSAAGALPAAMFAVLVVAWLAVAGMSMVRDNRPAAVARGLLGAAIIATLVAESGWAATHLAESVGQFARVSIGGGVWVSAMAAYTLILSSRRQVGQRTPVAHLIALLAPVAVLAMLFSGYLDDLGIMKEYFNVQDRFWIETVNTIVFAAVAVVLATAIGVWLGISAYRTPKLEKPVFTVVSVFQTIPGLAMVGLLVAPLATVSFALPVLRRLGIGGIGWAPVVIALTLYALLAIVRNTHAGLRGVPHAVIDAGRGMGMSEDQLLRKVELPLGMPVVFSGVRTSAVQTIGNATLGAFVGGITLGRFIFQGLAEQAPDLTMLGSIALVVIALSVDAALRQGQRAAFGRRARGAEGSGS